MNNGTSPILKLVELLEKLDRNSRRSLVKLHSLAQKLQNQQHPVQWATARVATHTRARWIFRHHQMGKGVVAEGPIILRAKGELVIGNRVVFLGYALPSVIIVHPQARIEVGDGTGFNFGVLLEASQQVKIGRNCLIGSHVRLADCGPVKPGPLVIEDNVWIAHGAIIESGVTIGQGAVVGAGSVVTKDVPPHCLALGNPAKIMSISMRTRDQLCFDRAK